MRLLFLTTRLPYPMDTGAKIRSWHLFSRIAGTHDITLLTFLHSQQDSQWLPVIRSLVPTARIETVDAPTLRSRIRSWWSTAEGLLSERPLTVTKYYSESMRDRIDALIGHAGFDLIHCDHVQLAQYVVGRTTLPVVLNAHNIDSVLLDRVAEGQRNLVLRRFYRNQQRKMAAYERTVYAASDRVVTVSAMDRERLKRLVPEAVSSVVINGVDTTYFSPTTAPAGPPTLTFTGSMDWLPNVDGALFFIREVLPLIRNAIPDVRFVVAGRNPSARILRARHGDPSLVVTGAVPDIRPWLVQSSVVVVPLLSGGGTRLKILEAMAMGKAVVSTTIGAEGLDVTPGQDIVIADDPKAFAEQTIALLSDHARTVRIGETAREWVVQRYDWEVAGCQLLEAYDRVMRRPLAHVGQGVADSTATSLVASNGGSAP